MRFRGAWKGRHLGEMASVGLRTGNGKESLNKEDAEMGLGRTAGEVQDCHYAERRSSAGPDERCCPTDRYLPAGSHIHVVPRSPPSCSIFTLVDQKYLHNLFCSRFDASGLSTSPSTIQSTAACTESALDMWPLTSEAAARSAPTRRMVGGFSLKTSEYFLDVFLYNHAMVVRAEAVGEQVFRKEPSRPRTCHSTR